MPARVNRKHLKESLDVVVLSFLNKRAMDGKDAPGLIYKKFRRYFSYTTINELLASLEKNKLIKSAIAENKKIYSITKSGKDVIKRSTKLLKELGVNSLGTIR